MSDAMKSKTDAGAASVSAGVDKSALNAGSALASVVPDETNKTGSLIKQQD